LTNFIVTVSLSDEKAARSAVLFLDCPGAKREINNLIYST